MTIPREIVYRSRAFHDIPCMEKNLNLKRLTVWGLIKLEYTLFTNGHQGMHSKFLQYEIKLNERDGWEIISEATALELLHDGFSRITPVIDEMLNGKEVIMSKGILRIRKLIE